MGHQALSIHFRRSSSVLCASSLAAALVVLSGGCKRTAPDDAALTSQVQSKLAADANLSGQPVQASVSGGVATLSGSVTSDGARTDAAGDAAEIQGIRTVVNNLTVQGGAPAAVVATAPARSEPMPVPTPKPSAAVLRDSERAERHLREQQGQQAAGQAQQPQDQTQAAPIVRSEPPSQPVEQAQAAPPPPPPPAQPVVREITLPAGTSLPVRITQTLDSATTQEGDKFTGAIASDIVIDGMVVLPQGTPVTGHVDAVQDAAHFKGSSLLTISLTALSRKGERVDIATDPYTKQGEGRGKNTAEKVGGGAVVGAILGGIFGGGKGAAIGSAAGAGVGAGAQGVTRGQQVQIPSETVVRFRLSNAARVRVTTRSGESGDGLERR